MIGSFEYNYYRHSRQEKQIITPKTTFNLLNGSRLLEHTVYKFQFYIYMKEVQSSNSNVGMHDCCAYLWATKENEGRPDFTDP